jgi:diacylglycerol kinase family enzyme
MTNVGDLKQIYNGASATAERKKREMEHNEKLLEENRIRREKATKEVDEIMLLCKNAAERGYKSCRMAGVSGISDGAEEILREKGIKFSYYGCETTFSGW